MFENRAAVYDEFEDDWDLNMRAMQKEREMNAEAFSDTTDEERYQTVGSALKHQPFVSKDYSELCKCVCVCVCVCVCLCVHCACNV